MERLLPLSVILVAFACAKPQEQVVPLVSGECGSDGHRIALEVDNSNWCANANIAAIASPDGELMVNGLAATGQLFGLQVDSIAVGTFAIDEMNNAVVWSEGGVTFTSTNDDPGTLHIDMHDATAQRLAGTFEVVVHDAENPASREITGSFDVTYTIGE